MRLLSRNAEALFWLARYLERGASLARVIEMQSSFGSHDPETGWSWLLTLHGDMERFKERLEVSSTNIISFYVTDRANAGSVRSSIHWARENARALRPFIPLEMWVQLNAFHAEVELIRAGDVLPAELPRTCARIRAGCLAQIGVVQGTLYRDEGYQFFRLGLLIERADQTSRLLDVKFAQSAAEARSPDPSEEFVFWSTILRTAAAYQVFRRLEQTDVIPERVARFLILDPGHPRSIAFCVRGVSQALNTLRGTFQIQKASGCLEACDMLADGLQAFSRDRDLLARLHDFNDWVQLRLVSVTDEIAKAFFPVPAPAPAAQPVPALDTSVEASGHGSQKQSQSQS